MCMIQIGYMAEFHVTKSTGLRATCDFQAQAAAVCGVVIERRVSNEASLSDEWGYSEGTGHKDKLRA